MTTSNLEHIRAEIAGRFENWRRRLLSPAAIAKLANDLGLGSYTASDITGLWDLGILRADLIISDVPFDKSDLISVNSFHQVTELAYCDFRRIEYRPNGYGSVLHGHQSESLENSLHFHPFRVYVLHHVARTLKLSTSNTQFLVFEPGLLNVIKRLQESTQHWTSSVQFCERFHYWNEVAEIAAVCEPIAYNVVFRDMEPASINAPIEDKFEIKICEMLTGIGRTTLRQVLSDLAFAATSHDENRSVHVLLRLMNWRERERIKGNLGCSMHFLSMAETIRRSAERAFSEYWPEEDEMGPGEWFPGARKMLYGSERVFDSPKSTLRDYLTTLGLDFGVKVRCYVEGDTEYGALTHAIGQFNHIQIINLSGNVAERRGKGLAFAESLMADMNSNVFSVVILDGDRDEYVRIVRMAAEKRQFHGRFFIFQPDIECGNFSPTELVKIAIGELEKNNENFTESSNIKATLLAEASSISSNGDLMALCKKHGLTNLRKSETWGKALMEYAISNPTFPSEDPREGQNRPIIIAAELLIRIRTIGFLRSFVVERIDATTGEIVKIPQNDKSE